LAAATLKAYPGLKIDVEEQLQYYISISERVNSMTVDTIQYTNDAYPNNIPVCGWLDIPQMQYSCLINGCTVINLTKLDVWTGLDEIQLCVRGYARIL
jgi:adenylosuccinate synthase